MDAKEMHHPLCISFLMIGVIEEVKKQCSSVSRTHHVEPVLSVINTQMTTHSFETKCLALLLL